MTDNRVCRTMTNCETPLVDSEKTQPFDVFGRFDSVNGLY